MKYNTIQYNIRGINNMGTNNVKCGITNTEIGVQQHNKDAVLIVLQEEYLERFNGKYMHSNDLFNLTSLIAKGEYDGYGSLQYETIEYDNQFKELLINAIQTIEPNYNEETKITVSKRLRDEERDVVKNIKGYDYKKDIMESERMEDVPYLTEEAIDLLLGGLKTMFIHRNVYDKLMGRKFEVSDNCVNIEVMKPFLKFKTELGTYMSQFSFDEVKEMGFKKMWFRLNKGLMYQWGNSWKIDDFKLYDIIKAYNLMRETEYTKIQEVLDDYFNGTYKLSHLQRDVRNMMELESARHYNDVELSFRDFESEYTNLRFVYKLSSNMSNFGVMIQPSLLTHEDMDKEYFNQLLIETATTMIEKG